MEHLTEQQFGDWMQATGIHLDRGTNRCHFESESEFMFRVPIGDYKLQLDYRLKAVLSLVPANQSLMIFRSGFEWQIDDVNYPLDALLASIGIHRFSAAIRLAVPERMLAFAIMYVTNRWAHAGQSIYVIAVKDPTAIIFMPASTESVFVIARTKDAHDEAVNLLGKIEVPAYGPHIRCPIREPIYKDIKMGRLNVTVDPITGRPSEPGSEESVLLPEFLPLEE